MSITTDIVRTYRGPGAVLRRRTDGPPNESRALIILMAACILMFIGRLPAISRTAHLDPTLARDALMGGALMGWVFIAPLMLYGLAGLSHLVALPFGGAARWYDARMALFWALLAATPLWLLLGLVEGFLGQGSAHTLTGALWALAFVVFWGAGLWAVERGPRTSE